MLLLSLPCCTTGEGVGAEGTSVTAGLESWAAGGTEQVGLFISSTGRLSPLGSGCNILKKKKRKRKNRSTCKCITIKMQIQRSGMSKGNSATQNYRYSAKRNLLLRRIPMACYCIPCFSRNSSFPHSLAALRTC